MNGRKIRMNGNEMLDNYMKILSEHSQELKDNLLNNNLDEGYNYSVKD